MSSIDDGDLTKREGRGAERSEPAAEPSDRFERGMSVGRYIVLDVLGEGGMGVVYAAYDPELDRKVAIKLLQARPGDESTGGQAWLLREAQALARLAHPNVIAVHDVGTLSGDKVFLAMELVEGQTLRAWLRERKHTWREVLPVMLGAGAGLAAAHAAGLVHRDFKPDNVLVGTDRRVRVMDFGLARLDVDGEEPARRTSDLQIERRSPLSDSLTAAGTVLGTPAYMAPEIYAGEPADVRSDQFAFGVALYEALFGSRPYAKDAPRNVPPKPPPDVGVPARIVRVAMRAIAVDPHERFPSLDALLAELAIDPFARRRRIAIAGGAAMLVALAGFGMYAMSHRHLDDQLCKGIDKRLAGVWDPAVKQTTHAAFTATKKPYAEAAYGALERALDKYTGDWTATVVESCEATRVRGDQSAEVAMLREDCLDQRLEDVRALTGLLATADASLVTKGDNIVRDLEPIARCSNVAALRTPVAPSVEVRAKKPELDKKLAEARADVLAGRYIAAGTAANAAIALARQLHFDPALADGEVVLGAAQIGLNTSDAAGATFADATYAALRGKRDDLVGKAALSAGIAASQSGQPHEADVWVGLAKAARVRFGTDPAAEVQALESEGVIAAGRGDMVAAVAAHQKALAASIALYKNADDPNVWHTEEMLGATLTKGGSYGDAQVHFEHALALRKAAVGPDHPDIALLLSNLGLCYGHAGDDAKARASFERALSIRERMYGPTSPMLIATLNNLADYLHRMGDVPAALRLIERGKQIAEKVPGTSHPLYHSVATTYAEVTAAAGPHWRKRAHSTKRCWRWKTRCTRRSCRRRRRRSRRSCSTSTSRPRPPTSPRARSPRSRRTAARTTPTSTSR